MRRTRRNHRNTRKSRRALRRSRRSRRHPKQRGGLYPIDPASRGAIVGYHRLDEKDGYTSEQMGIYDDVVEKIREDTGV
jgi:hypothetical protein